MTGRSFIGLSFALIRTVSIFVADDFDYREFRLHTNGCGGTAENLIFTVDGETTEFAGSLEQFCFRFIQSGLVGNPFLSAVGLWLGHIVVDIAQVAHFDVKTAIGCVEDELIIETHAVVGPSGALEIEVFFYTGHYQSAETVDVLDA